MTGAGQVLHICPPMHPKEDAIARTMIGLAGELAVDRFVLYSVLHPLLADVPHHDRKLQAERALVNSGLNYTILQPGRYMQHLTMIWKSGAGDRRAQHAVQHHGAIQPGRSGGLGGGVCASYDRARARGRDLSTRRPGRSQPGRLRGHSSTVLGRPIRAVAKPIEDFRRDAAAAGMPAERIEVMTKMNAHYDAHGLVGNPNVLRWLLGREPTRFADSSVANCLLGNRSVVVARSMGPLVSRIRVVQLGI